MLFPSSPNLRALSIRRIRELLRSATNRLRMQTDFQYNIVCAFIYINAEKKAEG